MQNKTMQRNNNLEHPQNPHMFINMLINSFVWAPLVFFMYLSKTALPYDF